MINRSVGRLQFVLFVAALTLGLINSWWHRNVLNWIGVTLLALGAGASMTFVRNLLRALLWRKRNDDTHSG